MKLFHKLLRKLLHPGYLIIEIVDITAFPLVIYSLAHLKPSHMVSLIAYALSAYAMTITCINFMGIVKRIIELITGDELAIVRAFKRFMRRYKYTKRYLEDREFRAETALYTGLFFNLLYAFLKGGSGLYYHSAWLISIGFYYLIFALIRFVLMQRVQKSKQKREKQYEWKTYRDCGYLMLIMNLAMAGMALQMIVKNQAAQYSKTLIILSATYTFYFFILSLTSMISFRKAKNTILSATKNLTFAGAVMSMYSLQTAMLAAFDEGEKTGFRRLMNSLTGLIVMAVVITIAIIMIRKGQKYLK